MTTNALTFPQPKCVTLQELVDEVQLSQLLKRPDVVDALDARATFDQRCNYQTTTLFNRLQALHRKTGKKTTQYAFGKRCTAGRVYAKQPSLQNIPRSVRQIICPSTLCDFDMVNADPTLIKQLCDKLGIKCTVLTVYVNMRERCLEKLKLNTREEARDVVLKVIFGGAVPDNCKKTWLSALASEMKHIRDEVCKKFPLTFAAVRHKGFAKSSAVCRVIGEIENMCLGALKDFAERQKLITRVLLFDGLFLEGEVPDDFCTAAQQHILQQTGFDIEIKQKCIVKKTVQEVAAELEESGELQAPSIDKADTDDVYLEDGIFPSAAVPACAWARLNRLSNL